MALLKIPNRPRLSERIHQAYLKFHKLCNGKGAKLNGETKRGLATRAACDHGLNYADGTVDPMILLAIFALANKKCGEEDRAHALAEAWEAYDRNFRTLH